MEDKAAETRRLLGGRWILLVASVVILAACAAEAKYEVADGPLLTPWAKKVSPKNALPEYPRPQMVRKPWLNLNGLWDYAIKPEDASQPSQFDGQILVPYPIESALSGVMKKVGKDNRLWYRRTVEIPKKWRDKRILLNFGAVDWDTNVLVNGKKVGSHKGGYDPFSFDITDALKDQGEQEIVLSVWDPTDAGTQPRGKQVGNPRGIWYTAVTGIWQTAWLEPVAPAHISSLKITPDIDQGRVLVQVNASGPGDLVADIRIPTGLFKSQTLAGVTGRPHAIEIPNAKLWSPDSPYLYDLEVTLRSDGRVVDSVKGYFGMRKIAMAKDEAGINRLFLNNEVVFQYGPLDQGWWPDGLYTAATDKALRHDIEVLKSLGCNMLRKHVKISPDRLYYWCDKLGLMVWQDMPSGDKYIGRNGADITRTPESAAQFEAELKAMISTFYNHPSIVMWVPYNEGWGQWDTERITKLIKKLDPTRLVNPASGWTDRGVGDVQDIHRYPGPGMAPLEEDRAVVLGEFGGLGLPVKGHTWQDEKNWGYRSFKTHEALTEAYVNLLGKVRPLIGQGLAAAVYTQTSDVEIEVNGMMTYDRAMIKFDPKQAAAAAKRLYLPPPIVTTIVPSSKAAPQQWRYTMDRPAAGWEKCEFDDSAWKKGPGGFGTKDTPGTTVRTEWSGSDIWVRRTFELAEKGDQISLTIHHDEDAEVYINGKLVKSLKDFTTDYIEVELDADALKVGTNCIAIHCKQTGGGQYIDAGLVEVTEQPEE